METASHAEQPVVVYPTAFEVIRPTSGRKPTRIVMSQGDHKSLPNVTEPTKDNQYPFRTDAKQSLQSLKYSLLQALNTAMIETDIDLPELQALSGYSKQYLSKIRNSTGDSVSIDKLMELLFLIGAENKVTLLLGQGARGRSAKQRT